MADNITFLCPHCNQSLEIEPAGAGLAVKCPACGNDVTVPKPGMQPPAATTRPPVSVRELPPGNITAPTADTLSMGKTTSLVSGRRPFLFSAVVTLALAFAIIAVVLLVITGIKYIRLAAPSSANVEYREIVPAAAIPAVEWKELEKQLAPIVLKHVSGKMAGGGSGPGNKEAVFLSWVSGMDAGERKEFCHNLEAIVQEAEQRSQDVWRVMNDYARLKQAKLRELRLQETSRRKSTSLKEMGLATAGLFVTAVLLALFAGVTVLLAVEKNTRRLRDN